MRSDPGLTVVTPDGWMASTLKGLIEARGFISEDSRMMAWYDAKVADEKRVTARKNRYFNCPSLDKDKLKEWLRALLIIMVVERDVGIILAGMVPANSTKIVELFTDAKEGVVGFTFCKVCLIYDRKQVDQLLLEGTRDKKRSRKAGFASTSYTEVAYVFWKGGGKRPKVHNRARLHVDPGSDVCSDVMLNVPVVPLEDRWTSPEATKKAVLKGSTWETLIDKDGSDSDDGSPDAGGQATAVDDNASSQATGRKRRRALLRAPTDADNVEVFSNPTHPLVLKEFLHEFKSSWIMCATPENGITLTAALSSDVRAPVLAFARNAAHKELVEQNVEKQLTNALVESRPSAAQPKVKQQTLVDLWERVRACEKTKN